MAVRQDFEGFHAPSIAIVSCTPSISQRYVNIYKHPDVWI